MTWKRIGTIRQSDGDFTGNSQYAAPWGPMVVFVQEDNRWHLVYCNYKSKPEYYNYDVDPDPWEGLRGVDSFFPYKLNDAWYGFFGSATLEKGKDCKWNIGLAKADKIEGPWKRMSDLNPIDSTHFAENPIVSQLDSGVYIAIVDGGPWVNKMGYLFSWDGIHWSRVRHIKDQPRRFGMLSKLSLRLTFVDTRQ